MNSLEGPCEQNAVHSTKVPIKRKATHRKKFNGKLSHATNISPTKITKYFDVKESVPCEETHKESVSITLSFITAKRNALHESNSKVVFQNNSDEDRYASGIIRDKLIVQPQHQQQTSITQSISPSGALAQLHIRNKKDTKAQRRLLPSFKSNGFVSEPDDLSKSQQSQITEYFPVRRSIRKTTNTVLAEKQKCLEEAVITKRESGLEVRAFLGKGRGVVATKKFEKGEFVVEYAGELISAEIAHQREVIYAQDENTGCYMYYFHYKQNKYCMDATPESNRLGRLLNHSRYGNLCPKAIEVNGIPHIVMVAKNDILPGAELTYDYGDRSKKSILYHPWLAQ